MKKRMLGKINLIVALIAMSGYSMPPNFIRTTICQVGHDEAGTTKDLISTEYSDGMGNGIQTKLKLDDLRDRVSCTYYDEIGRPNIVTKTFIDNVSPGNYLPGAIGDAAIKTKLEASNLGDTRAYSQMQYWDDPLGRIKEEFGPGAAYQSATFKTWTFGVKLTAIPSFTVSSGSADFVNGFINKINVADPSLKTMTNVINELYDAFLNANPFNPGATHLLTVSRDPDGMIFEVLKDGFGNTMATFASPDSNSTTGLKIMPDYTYDILGNVLRESPPNATNPVNPSQYKYNTLGQLMWKQMNNGSANGIYTYVYNSNGSLYQEISLRGLSADLVTEYSYDDLSRVNLITHYIVGVPQSFPVVYYYYDNFDHFNNSMKSLFSSIPDNYRDLMTNLRGRLAASVAVNYYADNTIYVGQLFSYNDEGKVNRKMTVISGSSILQETDYEYNIQGNKIEENFYYSGDHVRKKFTYDQLGRLDTVAQCIYNSITNAYTDKALAKNSYDDLGKLQNRTLSTIPSGIYTPGPYQVTNSYDIRDRLTNIEGGNKGFDEIIGYTPGGKVDNAQYVYYFGLGTFTNYSCSYGYDNVHRLTAATINDGTTTTNNNYQYDGVGRFQLKQEGSNNLTGYEYYDNNTRLKKTVKNTTGQEYIYDNHGNMVVDFLKKMVVEYDWRNLPVTYWFYNNLGGAGLQKNSEGDYNNYDKRLYEYIDEKVKDGTLTLISKVIMAYDAEGNRVCKMEVRE